MYKLGCKILRTMTLRVIIGSEIPKNRQFPSGEIEVTFFLLKKEMLNLSNDV